MTTNNPVVVVISAEIDIHTAIKAVLEFAEKYPVERLSLDQAYALMHAGNTMYGRVWDRDHGNKALGPCIYNLGNSKHPCGNPGKSVMRTGILSAVVCEEHIPIYKRHSWEETKERPD